MNNRALFCLLCIAVTFFGISSASAELRTFTNKDGNTLDAEVVGISSGKVSLKSGGNTFEVPVSQLSDADVDYLKEWYKNNPNYVIRISVFSQEGPSSASAGTAVGQNNNQYQSTKSVEAYHYLLSITNDSTVPLPDVEIDYRVFVSEFEKRGFGSNKEQSYVFGGKIYSGPVGVKDTLKASTATIALENKESSTKVTTRVTDTSTGASFRYSETKKNRARPKIQGFWAKVYVNGMMIKEYKNLNQELLHKDVAFASGDRPVDPVYMNGAKPGDE